MHLDNAGNIYVTGFSQNTNTNLGYVTVKYAPNGTQLWAARYDSTNYPSAMPAAIILDNSNNVIVTGNALTVKYDTNGNEPWSSPYAGSALALDSDANVYLTGIAQDFMSVKLNAQGSNVWTESYTDVGPTISQVIVVDNGNNVYVSGSDTYYCFQGGCYEQLLIEKYDENGTQLWSTTYNPGGPVHSVRVGGAALDGADNLYLLVSFEGVAMEYQTLKYAANGTIDWSENADRDAVSQGAGLVLDSRTNVLLTGMAGDYYPNFVYGSFKLNTNGSPVWTNFYPQPPVGISAATSITVDSPNNSYVTGYSPDANGTNDIVTIKYDPNGNQVWLQRYSSPSGGNAAGNAIAVDNHGNVYVTGYDTTAAGGTEIVTIKYSPVTLQRRSDGTVILKAQGSPGESFDIEASQDLLNWLDLGTFLADTNGLLQFDDTNAPAFPARFYYTSPQ